MIDERTKTVTLRFLREEILYDVKNYAFVHGDIMRTEDEHQRHQVIDIGEEGNVDRVTRVLNLVLAECRELLYPYTKREVEDEEERIDTLVEVEEYKIEMLVPDDFSKSTATYLEQLIHELAVDRVMFDWLSITEPDAAAGWKQKADATADAIKSALSKRIKRVRRRMHPFQ